jgi:hypothetical protein
MVLFEGIFCFNLCEEIDLPTVLRAVHQVMFGVFIMMCELNCSCIANLFPFFRSSLPAKASVYLFLATIAMGSSWWRFGMFAANISFATFLLVSSCCGGKLADATPPPEAPVSIKRTGNDTAVYMLRFIGICLCLGLIGVRPSAC